MIQFTAYDNNLWRIERTQKALKNFCEIFGITESQANTLIGELEDDRGHLRVHWRSECYPPTQEQVIAFGKAWGFCKEPSANVQHISE